LGCGPCCPGNPRSKKIKIGLQDVGLADLDRIFEEALRLTDCSDHELRALMLERVKARNYVPHGMEAEYADGIWNAFVDFRAQRERTGRN
jgi:hypothetical protein